MSLNKTLDRLFDEIRREARRNKAFADRIDTALQAHVSRREVDPASLEEAGDAATDAPVAASLAAPEPAPAAKSGTKPNGAAAAARALNPVGLYQREGEEALAEALAPHALPALKEMVREHNLDPSGEASEMDRDALAAHIVAQSKKRAERDKKLFDY
jgi:hypothetical protein